MAAKSFSLNTVPHEATVGDTTLLFLPEVDGPTFAEAYDALREVQVKVKNARGFKGSGKAANASVDLDRNLLVELTEAMRTFIARFLLDDAQRDEFGRMRLPDRILIEMMQWASELYGGGSGKDGDGGQSSD